MNEKTDPTYPFTDLTLRELIEVTQELLQEGLAAASASRISTQKISVGSYSGPLVRDLLLFWVSQATAARVRLQFWMETNEYGNGLQVKTIGQTFTHGSVLVMELISYMPNVVLYVKAISDLYGLPEYIPPFTQVH
jgi:hypothetical protein